MIPKVSSSRARSLEHDNIHHIKDDDLRIRQSIETTDHPFRVNVQSNFQRFVDFILRRPKFSPFIEAKGIYRNVLLKMTGSFQASLRTLSLMCSMKFVPGYVDEKFASLIGPAPNRQKHINDLKISGLTPNERLRSLFYRDAVARFEMFQLLVFCMVHFARFAMGFDPVVFEPVYCQDYLRRNNDGVITHMTEELLDNNFQRLELAYLHTEEIKNDVVRHLLSNISLGDIFYWVIAACIPSTLLIIGSAVIGLTITSLIFWKKNIVHAKYTDAMVFATPAISILLFVIVLLVFSIERRVAHRSAEIETMENELKQNELRERQGAEGLLGDQEPNRSREETGPPFVALANWDPSLPQIFRPGTVNLPCLDFDTLFTSPAKSQLFYIKPFENSSSSRGGLLSQIGFQRRSFLTTSVIAMTNDYLISSLTFRVTFVLNFLLGLIFVLAIANSNGKQNNDNSVSGEILNRATYSAESFTPATEMISPSSTVFAESIRYPESTVYPEPTASSEFMLYLEFTDDPDLVSYSEVTDYLESKGHSELTDYSESAINSKSTAYSKSAFSLELNVNPKFMGHPGSTDFSESTIYPESTVYLESTIFPESEAYSKFTIALKIIIEPALTDPASRDYPIITDPPKSTVHSQFTDYQTPEYLEAPDSTVVELPEFTGSSTL